MFEALDALPPIAPRRRFGFAGGSAVEGGAGFDFGAESRSESESDTTGAGGLVSAGF